MKQIIPAIIAVLFVVIGAAGGLFLKGAFTGGEASAASQAGYGKSGSGHGGDASEDAALTGEVTYYKFNREFVVPVTHGERVDSLGIINLNLEVDDSISSMLFGMEPKLRDNVMSTLIRLSNEGEVLGDLTDPENYETIRSMILANLREVVPHGLENVLILDMAKQHI